MVKKPIFASACAAFSGAGVRRGAAPLSPLFVESKLVLK